VESRISHTCFHIIFAPNKGCPSSTPGQLPRLCRPSKRAVRHFTAASPCTAAHSNSSSCRGCWTIYKLCLRALDILSLRVKRKTYAANNAFWYQDYACFELHLQTCALMAWCIFPMSVSKPIIPWCRIFLEKLTVAVSCGHKLRDSRQPIRTCVRKLSNLRC
jgi:hypothetical protein